MRELKERIDGLSEEEAKAALLKLCVEDGVAAYTFAERRKGTVEDYKIAILNGALSNGLCSDDDIMDSCEENNIPQNEAF